VLVLLGSVLNLTVAPKKCEHRTGCENKIIGTTATDTNKYMPYILMNYFIYKKRTYSIHEIEAKLSIL